MFRFGTSLKEVIEEDVPVRSPLKTATPVRDAKMRKVLKIILASLAAAPVAAAAATDVKRIHPLPPVYRHAQSVAATAQFAPYGDPYKGVPVMTLRAALQLPPSQLPTVFISPNPYQYYPYNVHETDGLSRNPDDCTRWGCIDHR
jgi:hypothetical protein